MKIAFISIPGEDYSASNLTHRWPISLWIYEVSNRIAKHHNVTIFSELKSGNKEVVEKNGIKNIKISSSLDLLITKLFKSTKLSNLLKLDSALYYKSYYFKTLYHLFYIAAVALKIRKEKIDTVLVLVFPQFVSVLRFFNKNVKIILLMQTDWLVELDTEETKRIIEKTDIVLGCSQYITKGVQKKFPQFEEKCFTLYNASNYEVFDRRALSDDPTKRIREELGLGNEKIILFVGRISAEKGVHVLIKAMSQVLESEPDCVLLILGGFYPHPPSPLWLKENNSQSNSFEVLKDDYEQYLKTLVNGIEDKVKFLGPQAHYKLPIYYATGDIFVHPAVWDEPFGMVLTEAMASDCPVISTSAGAMPEIVVDGETGLLVKPGDSEALAAAILHLLSNETLRKSMGEAGRRRVEKEFSWENVAESFLKIISDKSLEGVEPI
jgi:glycosyltransferase involved in cell wall biosynthesis